MALKFYSGWLKLAGDFPPTLNTYTDPIRLKPNESPAAYGIDPDIDGYLQAGTIPTGTARNAPAGDNNYSSWNYYYDRLWNDTGPVLRMGAPHYRDVYYRQGTSRFETDTNIVTFMPAHEASMWIVMEKGSQFLQRVNDGRAYYELTPMRQELWADTSVNCITLDGQPFASNTRGVFSFDGNETKEWTQPVSDTLGSFRSRAILADYDRKYIIGTDKFVIDTKNGKLFDFGTTGFLFTTRTLTSENEFNPFQIISAAFIISQTDDAGGTISWQSKVEHGDWTSEPDIEVTAEEGGYTRIEREIDQTSQNCYRFALRITAMSDNIRIREILVNVCNWAHGSFTE